MTPFITRLGFWGLSTDIKQIGTLPKGLQLKSSIKNFVTFRGRGGFSLGDTKLLVPSWRVGCKRPVNSFVTFWGGGSSWSFLGKSHNISDLSKIYLLKYMDFIHSQAPSHWVFFSDHHPADCDARGEKLVGKRNKKLGRGIENKKSFSSRTMRIWKGQGKVLK